LLLDCIIPKANENDIILTKENRDKIKIIPVSTIYEVLKNTFVWKGHENTLRKIQSRSKAK